MVVTFGESVERLLERGSSRDRHSETSSADYSGPDVIRFLAWRRQFRKSVFRIARLPWEGQLARIERRLSSRGAQPFSEPVSGRRTSSLRYTGGRHACLDGASGPVELTSSGGDVRNDGDRTLSLFRDRNTLQPTRFEIHAPGRDDRGQGRGLILDPSAMVSSVALFPLLLPRSTNRIVDRSSSSPARGNRRSQRLIDRPGRTGCGYRISDQVGQGDV